ncbi:helix-turn-helix transcriptional regulator [Actinokineospora enzanensis]|uniref:helix-turn-helix transcriptional regulator n=1 Tax=Actinokineospora enzanensis TaxID=155975 RepID=UPI0003784C3A|nr:response regulator transcription factor [Actinokineospora enzanensis]
MPKTISVLLLYGSLLLREALRNALAAEGRFVVVGATDLDGPEMQLLLDACPDVVVVGGAPAFALAQCLGGLRLVARSLRSVAISQSRDLGADVHLAPDSPFGHLTDAIVTADRRDDGVVLMLPTARAQQDDPYDEQRRQLSVRESEVLDLVASGMSNRQIATHLSIAEGTVKRHLRNIFGKLGAVSRIDAVNRSNQDGRLGIRLDRPITPPEHHDRLRACSGHDRKPALADRYAQR